MTKKALPLVRDPLTGHMMAQGYPAPVPYAYVVKCAGGCGADINVPLKKRWTDGRVEKGDPNAPVWCIYCGADRFMGLDLAPPINKEG